MSEPSPEQPKKGRVVVIGAYGLIGYAIATRLMSEGFDVIGVGRNSDAARSTLPDVEWIIQDIAQLCRAQEWHAILSGAQAVVNCSGALQDGPTETLQTLHVDAVDALAQACAELDVRLVQMSAVGADAAATTEFLASKGRGDDAIRASKARFQIFKPGMVIGQAAYGGSVMVRMLAAVPLVQPLAKPDAAIQTVALDDVARVVLAAVSGAMPDRFEADLVEDSPHTLRDVIASTRRWLGFAPARAEILCPDWLTSWVAQCADGLGRLGWRSPLRSTGVRVLEDGVRGTPSDLTPFGVGRLKSLRQNLASLPAGAQDRLYARMALLMPVMIAALAVFWIASGVIGMLRVDAAAQTLEAVEWPRGLAVASVLFWAVVDIVIGIAFLVKRYAKQACWAAILVSLFYLGASTVVTPHLWLDPLGPLVKIIPGMVLALVARAALEER